MLTSTKKTSSSLAYDISSLCSISNIKNIVSSYARSLRALGQRFKSYLGNIKHQRHNNINYMSFLLYMTIDEQEKSRLYYSKNTDKDAKTGQSYPLKPLRQLCYCSAAFCSPQQEWRGNTL